MASPGGLGIVRDRFGFKPLMVAETDEFRFRGVRSPYDIDICQVLLPDLGRQLIWRIGHGSGFTRRAIDRNPAAWRLRQNGRERRRPRIAVTTLECVVAHRQPSSHDPHHWETVSRYAVAGPEV